MVLIPEGVIFGIFEGLFMLLHSLTLENVRIFQGRNVLDFRPKTNGNTPKPIILIGGRNGAGKTTLFDSILLCLYGQYAPGNKMSNTKYEKYVRQMVPRSRNTSNTIRPIIEIIFEFTHAGVKKVYEVRREWFFDPKFSEKLTIQHDGEVLSDLERDQWQELLNELIPPRFARLFLFDGEKIQNLVEDNAENIYLRDSFKSLLGLDIVDRLRADLGIFSSRHLKGSKVTSIDQNLEDIMKQISDKEHLLDDVFQERAKIKSQSDQIKAEIERQEQILAGEGGGYARKREEWKGEKIRLEHEIEKVENELRDLCAGLFPFSITPQYCKILKDNITKEDAIQTQKRLKELIQANMSDFDKAIQSSEFWSDISVPSEQIEKIREKIVTLIKNQLEPGDDHIGKKLIHQVSQAEYHQLLQWIDEAVSRVPQKMNTLSETLEKLTHQRQKIVGNINKAPDDEIIAPYIQELNKLNKSFGGLEEKLNTLDTSMRELTFQLNELNRKREKSLEEIQSVKSDSKKLDLAHKVIRVLDDYATELQEQKVKQLADNILMCFNRLIRKDDYVRNLVIDGDYTITLYDHDGQVIPKELLSAGEKEIFAVSLLWGLTLTSSRELPFIIDTPLGRLDSEHRGNLVMDFFQHAGEQMIIFSTDTEIDLEYFRTLQPYISRAYHLDYSKKDRMTSISPGYFWSEVEV
nr:DNA sulfur modification protein DndD [Methanocalculus alkaliphilus]